MNMTKKMKWRLSELPTPAEVSLLLDKEILTKEEAREILISIETDEDRDKKSLQGEIKFLRELVEKLSNNRKADIIREITVIEKPYIRQPWFQPYYFYATAGSSLNLLASGGTGSTTSAMSTLGSATNAVYGVPNATVPAAFSEIKTF